MARITVEGNVGTDAEIKFFNGKNGQFGITSFSLAETPRENKNGEWVDGETIWYRVSVLGKDAEDATEIKKGDKIVVVGLFKQSTYTAKDGTVKTGLEIKAESYGVKPKSRTKTSQPRAAEADSFWG